MPEYEDVVALAEEWLGAGIAELEEGRHHVAFEALRNAAELAGKALLLRQTASFPQDHAIAGLLARADLVPSDVDARDLHRLLSRFTVGPYGFEVTVHRKDVIAARRIAERMVKACRR